MTLMSSATYEGTGVSVLPFLLQVFHCSVIEQCFSNTQLSRVLTVKKLDNW